jgi:hypothetical protein
MYDELERIWKEAVGAVWCVRNFGREAGSPIRAEEPRSGARELSFGFAVL